MSVRQPTSQALVYLPTNYVHFEKSAFSVRSYEELRKVLDNLFGNVNKIKELSRISSDYVMLNKGATDKIFQAILASEG